MYFPQWVDSQKSDPARATARLNFIFYLLALHHCRRPTVRALIKKLKLPAGVAANISVHIKKGSISRPLAQTIIKKVGTDMITEDHLVYPLEIKPTSKPAV